MRLQYLGHSCFRIISQMGTAVVCDPFDGAMVGFEMPKLSCDVVTVSHHHGDHDFVEGLRGTPALLEKQVFVAADDVAVQSFPCWHDDQQGKLRGENFAFCFSVDGLKVAHLGDIGERDETLAAKLKGCDILLVPVGGYFTIDAEGAKWYVDKIQPKICVPMHYKTEEYPDSFPIAGVAEFTKLFPAEQVKRLSGETLVVDDLPEEGLQIVVLERYRD